MTALHWNQKRSIFFLQNIYRSGHALITSCSIHPSPWKWSYISHGQNSKNLSVPPLSWGVTRVTNMKILGVTITGTLSFEPHVTNVLARCSQTGYALRILRAHGLNGPALWNVTRATLISKLIYASPAWFGFLDESSKTCCQGIITKLIRTEYLGEGFPELRWAVWACGWWVVQKHPNKQSPCSPPTPASNQKQPTCIATLGSSISNPICKKWCPPK